MDPYCQRGVWTRLPISLMSQHSSTLAPVMKPFKERTLAHRVVLAPPVAFSEPTNGVRQRGGSPPGPLWVVSDATGGNE